MIPAEKSWRLRWKSDKSVLVGSIHIVPLLCPPRYRVDYILDSFGSVAWARLMGQIPSALDYLAAGSQNDVGSCGAFCTLLSTQSASQARPEF